MQFKLSVLIPPSNPEQINRDSRDHARDPAHHLNIPSRQRFRSVFRI